MSVSVHWQSEGDLAAMIFEHFVQRGSDGECQDSVGDGEQHESGLAQAGTGRGLGFARRLRAVLAEADTKLPGVDTAAEQGDDRLHDDKEETEEQLSAAPSQALSHTRSHRKRLAGAYSDQTRTGYVNTFSSVRLRETIAASSSTCTFGCDHCPVLLTGDRTVVNA